MIRRVIVHFVINILVIRVQRYKKKVNVNNEIVKNLLPPVTFLFRQSRTGANSSLFTLF
jgi:hypothetical protein